MNARALPPAAALTAAAALQVAAVTDLVGGAISHTTQSARIGYAAGFLFGALVAATFEGGAALLLDLYDRHLIAGDSVAGIKLAMIAWVAASAAGIHYWAAYRHIPGVLPWLLAAMSASALYMWAASARWKRREVMRASGLIDPAMPRLPAAAKLMHPIRWVRTMWLISWEPARSTDEARARYAAHVGAPTAGVVERPAITTQPHSDTHAITTQPHATQPPTCAQGEPTTQDQPPTNPPTHDTETVTVTRTVTESVTTSRPTVEDLAAALRDAPELGGAIPGRPTALRILKGQFGSCSDERAKAAINTLRGWADGPH